MGLFSKIVDTVSDVYNSTVGDIINPSNYLTRELTGLSNTQQLGVGATGGLLNMLGSGDGNNSLLSTIFGSGDNSLSSILGSVVKGAVGIGSSYFENKQYLKDQKELNAQKFGYDRQLADEAYQRDVAMWNMQNAYNAPSAQMQRLQKAGLNPNLVYGSGSVTGNTAGSPPSYPQVTYPDSKAQKLDLMRNVLGIFDEYQSIKNQALENQRANARIALQEEQMRLNEKRLDKQDRDSERRFQIMLANLGLARERQSSNDAERERKKVNENAKKNRGILVNAVEDYNNLIRYIGTGGESILPTYYRSYKGKRF